MAEDKKKKQQLQMALIGGAVVVAAGLGYYYWSSQKTDESTNDQNDDNKNDKIEQITYAGDNEEPIQSINKSKDSTQYESKSYDDEDIPVTDTMNNEQIPDESQLSNDTEIKQEEPQQIEVEEPKQPAQPQIVEEEPEEEEKPKEPKEESPVIIDKATDTEPAQKTEAEIEAEKKQKAEEERLNNLIKKYDGITDKVRKLQRLNYKNGKIRVKLLKATNVDDKDSGKKDLSDVFVKLEVSNIKKHEKSSIKKDTRNPEWNEVFILDVKDTLKEVLTLSVLDKDTMINDSIGKVEIPIIDVVGSKDSCIKNREFEVIGSKTGCKLFVDLDYFEEEVKPKKK